MSGCWCRCWWPPSAALLFLGFLLLYDWRWRCLGLAIPADRRRIVPVWSQRLGAEPGRRLAEDEGELRTAFIDGLQGMAELPVYGASGTQPRPESTAWAGRLIADQVPLEPRYAGIGAGGGGSERPA